mgnify:CR=1 FL=1
MTPETAAVEAIALLRSSPPRSAIADQRYWDWRRQVEVLLAKLDAD